MRFAELLTQAEVKRTHEASLEVLETVGVLAHYAGAREVFKTAIAASAFSCRPCAAPLRALMNAA